MPENRTILVVDDEESDRSIIRGALEAEGFNVLAAECYEDAVAAVEENRNISFLVADVALPDGNGCALALALHQQMPALKVLFVSGHVGGEACRYYGLDVTDLHFMRKPFNAPDLVARVKEVMLSDVAFPALYVPKTWSAT